MFKGKINKKAIIAVLLVAALVATQLTSIMVGSLAAPAFSASTMQWVSWAAGSYHFSTEGYTFKDPYSESDQTYKAEAYIGDIRLNATQALASGTLRINGQRAYCIQKGQRLPTAKRVAYRIEDTIVGQKLSTEAIRGIKWTLTFGAPNVSPSYYGKPDTDEERSKLEATTQVIIWEFQVGFRVGFEDLTEHTDTSRSKLAYLHMIVPNGLEHYYLSMMDAMRRVDKKPSFVGGALPAEFAYNENSKKYELEVIDTNETKAVLKIVGANPADVVIEQNPEAFYYKFIVNNPEKAFVLQLERTDIPKARVDELGPVLVWIEEDKNPYDVPEDQLVITGAEVISFEYSLRGSTTPQDLKVNAQKHSDPVQGSVLKVGDTITYYIDVINSGTFKATDIVIQDWVPAHTKLARNDDGSFKIFVEGGAEAQANVEVTPPSDASDGVAGELIGWLIKELAPGAVQTVSFVVVVQEMGEGEDARFIRNFACVQGDATNTIEHQQIPSRLSFVKRANPISGSIVKTGNTIDYTITVRNSGPEDIGNVTVSDPVPYGTTYVADSVNTVGDNPAGKYIEGRLTPDGRREAGEVRWDTQTIPAGAAIDFTYSVTVDPLEEGVPMRTFINAAFVNGSPTNTIEHYQYSGSITAVKSASPASGAIVDSTSTQINKNQITYKISVKNHGYESKSGIKVTDKIPDGTTYVSSSPSVTPSNGELSWTINNLAAGETRDITFVVKVDDLPPGVQFRSIENYAIVDAVPTNYTYHYQHSAEVIGVKSASPAAGSAVYEKGKITYTIQVHNTGAAAAKNVKVTDTIPANTTYDTETHPAGTTFNKTGDNLEWVIDTIGAGASKSVTFRVEIKKIPEGLTVNEFRNIAYINGVNTNETIHYQYAGAIAGVKRSEPMTGTAMSENGEIIYYIDVINNGADTMYKIPVTDQIPDNTTFVDFVAVNGQAKDAHGATNTNGKNFSWEIASIEAGKTITVAFKVKVGKMPQGVESREFRNVAYVNGINTNETEHYQYAGNIRGVKRSDPMTGTTVFEHEEIIYYIDIINDGADAMYNIPVTDQLPDNTVFVDFVDCGQPDGKLAHHAEAHNDNTDFSWMVDKIEAGKIITVGFKVKLLEMPTNISQREFRNVAYVNHINTNETEHYQYNWKIVPFKRALPPTGSRIHEGSTVKYYIDVTNKGADVANKVEVTDQIPDGMTYVAGTGTTGTNFTRTEPGATGKGEIKWIVDKIQPNETITIEFDVKADNLPAGDLWKQIVNVAYADKNFSNEVEHEVRKDMLHYNKTATPPHDSIVEEGDTIRYNIHVENNGDMKGRDIVITDVVPLGTTLVEGTISHDGVYTEADRTITWTFDTVSIGEKFDLTFEVTVDPLGFNIIFDGLGFRHPIKERRLENFAIVDGGKTNITYHHVKKPVIEYSKDSNPVTETVVMENQNITYNITVKNVGTLSDKSVLVVDNIPEGTRFVEGSITNGGTYKTNPNRVEWTIDEIKPNQSIYLSFQVETRPLAYGLREFTVTNKAQITAYDVPGLDTNTVEHYVYANRLWATKAADPVDNTSVRVGEQIKYTVTVINKRGQDAYYVPVADTIPVGTTYVPGSASDGGIYDPVGRRITWVIPYVEAYVEGSPSTYTHEVSFKVTADNLDPGEFYRDILNMALVGEGGTKTNPGVPTIPTNEVTHTVIEPIIQPSKTSVPEPNSQVNVGEEILYKIMLHNNTDETVINVPVTDIIPEGTTYRMGSAAISNGVPGRVAYNPTTKQVSWTVSSIGPKGDAEVTFKVVVNELPYGKATTTIRNIAYCGNGGGTIDFPGEADIATEEVLHIAKLPPVVGEKTSRPPSRSKVVEGQTITYYVKVKNMASVPVTNVTVSDSIPAGTTFASAANLPVQGEYNEASKKVEWVDISLGANGTVDESGKPADEMTLEFDVTVNKLDAGLTTRVINNTAVVSGTATNYVTHTVEKSTLYGEKDSLPKSGSYVIANEKVTYTIVVTNDSDTPKENVVVKDSIPVGATYVIDSGTTLHRYNYVAGGGKFGRGEVSWEIAEVRKGSPVTLTFDVTIDPITSGKRIDTIRNTGIVVDPDTGEELVTNEVNHTIFATPYFGVKSSVPAPGSVVKTGNNIEYTIVVTNTDRVRTPMLTITDSIPAGTEYVEGSAKLDVNGIITEGSFDQYANMVMWSVPGLDPDESVTVTFDVTVLDMDPSMTQRYIDNVGAVNTTPTNTVTHVQENALLEMVKSSDPVDKERVAPGQVITYFVEVINNNDYPINNVEIVDYIPAGTTYVADSASDVFTWDSINKKLTWSVASIPANDSAIVSFEVKVDKLPATMASTQLMNVALVNGIPTNRITHEVKKPLIVGSKTANPIDKVPYTLVNEGQIIRYAVTIKNIGEITAHNIPIKDITPEFTTLLEDTITDGGVVTARDINWVIPSLANGQEKTVYFSVSIDKLPDGLATRLIKNTGLYGQGGEEPETPTNETIHIVNKSEIEFKKYATPKAGSQVVIGSTINYNISLHNKGILKNENTYITDDIPVGTKFVPGSIRGNGEYDSETNSIEWVVSSIGSGATEYIGFDVIVLESAIDNEDSQVKNIAYVDKAATEEVIHNVVVPDVFVVKSAMPPERSYDEEGKIVNSGEVAPGDEITYKLTVKNNNPTAVVFVPITDVIPIGTTYVEGSVSHDGLYELGNSRLRWTIPVMQPGEELELTFKVTADDLDPAVKTLEVTNSAMYGQGGGTVLVPGIPDTETNKVTHVVERPHISAEKTANPPSGSSVIAGTAILFTITVHNFGPEDVQVPISDRISEDFIVDLGTISHGGQYDAGTRTITWTNIHAGKLDTVEGYVSYVARPKALDTGIVQKVIYNQAVVNNKNTNITNHTVVRNITDPDLRINKATTALHPNNSTVVKDDIITYNITVENYGLGIAHNVSVTDDVPLGTDYVEGSAKLNGERANVSDTSSKLTWNIGDLAYGESAIMTFDVKVKDLGSLSYRTIENVATVMGSNSPTKESGKIIHHQLKPDGDEISATKSATVNGLNVTTVKLNGKIHYTIAVKNETASPISNVTVTDSIQAGATYVPGSGGSYSNGIVTFIIPFIAGGDTETVSFDVYADGTYNNIYNKAIARTSTSAVETNQTHHILEASPLKISKSADKAIGSTVQTGSTIKYTITVENTTNEAIEGIEIVDRIPTGTEYQSMSTANAGRIDGNSVKWTIASLPGKDAAELLPGSNIVTVDFTVKVTATGGDIYNTAYVNDVPTNTTVHYVGTPDPRVRLFKSADPAAGTMVKSGSTITYYVTVTNTGATAAEEVKVEDLIPAGTTYVPNSAKIDGVEVVNACDGVKVAWNIGTLAAEDSRLLSFQVKVNAVTSLRLLTNQATGESKDGTFTSNTVIHPLPTPLDPDVIIIKESDPRPGPVYAGDLITYTITVSSASDEEGLENVVVTDFVPSGTEYVSGGTHIGNRVVWNVGEIEAGDSAEVSFVVKVLNMGNITTDILNKATVTSNKGTKESNEVRHIYLPVPYDITAVKRSDHPIELVKIGDEFEYIITITNNTSNEVRDIVLRDTPPVGTTYLGGATVTGSGTTAADGIESGGTITWTIDKISANGTAIARFRVAVNGNAQTMDNTGYLTYGGRTSATNRTRHRLPIIPDKPLIIGKSIEDKPDGAQVAVDEIIKYKISVRNNTAVEATNIAISDMIPAGTEYVAGSASHEGVPTGNTLNWTIDTLAPNEEVIVTFEVKMLPIAPLVYRRVDNTAVVNGENTRIVTVYVVDTPITGPYIVTHKSASPASGSRVALGDPITYYISATNLGTIDAENVVVTDIIPQGTEYVVGSASGNGAPNAGGTGLEWNVGTLRANGGNFEGSFQVTVINADLESITNTATVGGSNFTPINTNPVTHYPKRSGAVSIKKTTVGNSSVAPGGIITYEITVKNNSAAPVQGVKVSDNIPSGTTLQEGTISSPGENIDGKIVWNLGTLAPGQVEVLTFDVKVNANTEFNTITNIAELHTPDEPGDPTPPVVTIVEPVKLRATKSADPTGGRVQVGDTITYTIEVINDSTVEVEDVVITDNIPSGTTYVESSVSPGGTPAPGKITWNIGTMQPNDRVTVSFQVKATQPNSHIINRAVARAGEGSGFYTNETHHYTGDSDVRLTKWASAGNGSKVNAGEEFTYFLSAQNTGNAVANNVTVSDRIPAELTYVVNSASPAATQTGDTLEWNLGTLQPNETKTVSFRVKPTDMPANMSYRQIDNKGTVSYTGGTGTGTITSDSNHVINYQVGPNPSVISIVKSADRLEYIVPQNTDLTYFLDVTNNGGVVANSVKVYDLIPTGTTLVSVHNGGSELDGEVSWTIDTLAPGQTRRVAFTVNTGSSSIGSIINTARAIYESRMSISNTIIHQRPIDDINFTVNKRSDKLGQPVRPGESIKYMVDITNISSKTLTGMHVYDMIPAGTEYQLNSAVPSAAYANGTLDWTIASIAPGQTITVSFDVKVAATATGSIRNIATATISGVTRVSNEVVNVIPGPVDPYLVATKRGSHDSVVTPGSTITYYIDVTNSGNADAENVVVTDVTPAYTTITSVIGGTNENGVATWNVGTIAAGATKTVSMVVRVNNGTPRGTVINNVATVSYPGHTFQTNIYTVVVDGPDDNERFTVSKRADKYGTVNTNDTVTYYIDVLNTGNTTINGLHVYDVVPTGTTYVQNSANPSAVVTEGNKLDWTVASIAPGQTATVSFDVKVSATTAMLIRNVATAVKGNKTETSNEVTLMTGNPFVSVQPTKRGVHTNPVKAGDTVIYYIDVTNYGTSPAENVIVTDTAPAETTISTVTGGTNNNGTATWNVGTIEPGATKTVSMMVTVNSGLANGTIVNNVANVTYTGGSIPTNNYTFIVTEGSDPDPASYTINKRSDKAGQTVRAGDTVKFFIDVTNTGNKAITGLHVYDVIPNGTEYKQNSASPATNLTNNALDWTATIAPGQTATFSFEVTVTATYKMTIRNTAISYIGSTTKHSNEVIVNVDGGDGPVVQIHKSGSYSGALKAGSQLTYSMEVINTSSVAAENVVVTDVAPANTTISSVIGGTNNNGTATWNVGTLAPGQRTTVSMIVTINNNVPAYTTIINTANATYTGGTAQSNPYIVITGDDTEYPNFTINKRSDKGSQTVKAGDTVKFTIDVTNTGTTTLTNFRVFDVIPYGTEYIQGTSYPSAVFANNSLDWTISSIAPGHTSTVSFDVRVTVAYAMIIRNTATGSDGTKSKQSNEVTVIVTDDGGVKPQIQVNKSGIHNEVVEAGSQITYNIEVVNTGTVAAENVVVTDVAPAGTTINSVIGGTNNNGTATWYVGTLAAGQRRTVSMTVNVNSGVPSGTIINNIANVTYTGGSTPSNNYTVIVSGGGQDYQLFTVSKRSDKNEAKAGDIVRFTVDVTNVSNTTLNGMKVNDVIPTGTEYVQGSANPSANITGNVLTWNLAPIAAGQTVTVSFDVRVTATYAMFVENTAIASTPTTGKPSNKVVVVITDDGGTVTNPQISVVKTGIHANPVKAGSTIVYNVEVVNIGSVPAQNVVVTDTAPAGTSILSVTDGTNNNGTATWNVGTMQPGQRTTVSMTVTVNSDVVSNTIINNVANVTYTGGSQPSNNYTVITSDNGGGYLTVSKRSDKTGQSVKAGDTVKFTVDVTNVGTTAMTGVQVNDVIPTGTEYIQGSASPSATFANNTLTWTLASIAPGQTATVSFDARVTATYAMTIRNRAIATHGGTSTPSNETTVIVIDGGDNNRPQIQVNKSGIHNEVVQSGSQITYNIEVVNTGSAAAQNVVVTDVAPAGTTIATVTGGTNNNGVATWNIGTLAAGERRTVSMIVTVNNGTAPGTIINNIANVTYTGGSTPSNNYTVIISGDPGEYQFFTVNKRSDKSQAVRAGDIVKFTVDVTNVSNTTLTGMKVVDVIPTGTEYVQGSASPSASFANNTLTWNLSPIAPGQIATVSFDVRVTATYAMFVRNTAIASTPTTGKPSNEVTVEVRRDGDDNNNPRIQLNKTGVYANPVKAGSTIVYNIEVVNTGNAPAQNVVVTDVAPAGTSISTVTGGYNNNGVATWNVGTLQPGERKIVSMIVTVNSGIADNSIITNVANATYIGGSGQSNYYTIITGGGNDYDYFNFDISKRSNKTGTVNVGDRITYYIEVVNTGNVTLNNLNVYDYIPFGTTYQNVTNTPATFDGSRLNWVISSLAPGGRATISFEVEVTDAAAQVVRNTATGSVLAGGSTGTTITKTSNEVILYLYNGGVTPGNITASKQASASNVAAGSQFTYYINVRNNGSTAVNNVVVTDILSSDLSYISSSNGGMLDGSTGGNHSGRVVWNLGTLNAGETVILSVTVSVRNGVANGTVINNMANVTYTGGSTVTNNVVTIVTGGNDDDNRGGYMVNKRSDRYGAVNNGDTIKYYIDVTNVGNIGLSNIQIYDYIPFGTTYQQNSANPTANFNNGTLNWTVPYLAPGQVATVSFEVRVDSNATNQIRNTATITANNVTKTTNEIVNNIGTGGPGYSNVMASKRANVSTASAGSLITYYIDVTNRGSYTVNSVEVRDTVPYGTTYQSSTPYGNNNNGVVTWQIGSLLPGETKTVTMTVRVNNGITSGTINNYATVTSSDGTITTNTHTTVIGHGNNNCNCGNNCQCTTNNHCGCGGHGNNNCNCGGNSYYCQCGGGSAGHRPNCPCDRNNINCNCGGNSYYCQCGGGSAGHRPNCPCDRNNNNCNCGGNSYYCQCGGGNAGHRPNCPCGNTNTNCNCGNSNSNCGCGNSTTGCNCGGSGNSQCKCGSSNNQCNCGGNSNICKCGGGSTGHTANCTCGNSGHTGNNACYCGGNSNACKCGGGSTGHTTNCGCGSGTGTGTGTGSNGNSSGDNGSSAGDGGNANTNNNYITINNNVNGDGSGSSNSGSGSGDSASGSGSSTNSSSNNSSSNSSSNAGSVPKTNQDAPIWIIIILAISAAAAVMVFIVLPRRKRERE